MGSLEATPPGGRSRPGHGPPTLVVMVGPPGTGKSHLARLVAARVPLEIVESDEIRRRLSSRPTYSAEENRKVFSLAHRGIAGALRQGTDVLFDATNVREWNRRRVYHIAERLGARLLIVRTLAPDEVVAERLRRRKAGLGQPDRSEAGWEVNLRMKGEFEEIRHPHLVVDTSQDLQSAVDEIVRFLQGTE